VQDKWSVIGAAWNDETELMVKYIWDKTGEEPKYFALYSTMMAFIRHAGIDENRPVAFRNGNLIGQFEEVRKVV
jgi:hypothetical protein